MLVLSRKVGEEIVLPDHQVCVSVLGVSGKRVRLGITAPPDTRVHRMEVWLKLPEEAEPVLGGPVPCGPSPVVNLCPSCSAS